MRASNSAAEIRAIALVSAAKTDLTPALVDVLNEYPHSTRAAIVSLAIRLSDVSIAP
jgi:hypothetical protein